MNVAPGTRLGPYEIVSHIGAGGMGEVWQARDTRLDRSVAIKILPAEFANNAQLKLRFEREAKTISQLNHPHICTLHDVGHESGIDFLVMELIEGESLADRLARGPLPLDQMLKSGVEIAGALERAHRHGVVHRDLKPGNIMMTKSGTKLLDFGLAKPGAITTPASTAAAMLTEQKPLTQEGAIVGTFQYMAPEQIEGAEADARTDIFAFGAVLYEMATGHRAFDGKSRASIIASILDREPPPISTIQPLTPPALEHVIRKCLEKDPDKRWQNAHDVGENLRWIAEQRQDGTAHGRSRAKPWMLATAALAAVAVICGILALAARHAAGREPHLELSITMPSLSYFDNVTLSPDGRRVVFVGYTEKRPSLWIRSLDVTTATPLAGTEGARSAFWSPDGKQIGFFAGGKLKRISSDGGPVQIVCDAADPSGGAWTADGTIILSRQTTSAMDRVDATGGTAKPLTKLGPNEEAHRWPFLLPDGEHFLFLADAWRTEDHHLKIGSLKTDAVRELMQAVTNVQYVAPGYLLFVRGGSLMAQPFDWKRLSLGGEAQAIAPQLAVNGPNHHFEFSAADNGRLTFRSASPKSRLTWVDRNGKPQQTVSEPHSFADLAIAPDGKRILFTELDDDGRADDIWLLDLARGSARRITTDPAGDFSPAWSPDGRSMAFASMRSGIGDGFVIDDLDHPANVRTILKATGGCNPTDWTSGGDILFDYLHGSDVDVWTFSIKSGQAKPYLATPFVESSAVVSPDGAWMAYQSNESGRAEVFLERYPSHEGRRQISTAGGFTPTWRKDGRELFFVAPGPTVMSAQLTDDALPKPLFNLPGNLYRPSADGQRFLIDAPLEDVTKMPVTFVTDWQSRLKTR